MGRWAQRRRSGTDSTAALTAAVVSVVKGASNQLTWTFNVIVTSNGAACLQLRDNSLGGNAPPFSTAQAGTKSVLCAYTGAVNVGDAWAIVATPANLTNPNGSGFVVPQSGTVT